MTRRLTLFAAAAVQHAALTACGARTGLESDAPGLTDAGDQGAADAGTIPPRPIAPLSTSFVTSRRPTLRWELPSGVTEATVDLCFDRTCTGRIGAPAHVRGTHYAPAMDLPIGVVYWRLHPSTVTTVSSPTWQFTVGARSASVDSSWGTTLDTNGDGYADLTVAAINGVYVYLGSATGLATAPATTLVAPSEATGGPICVASAGDVNGDGYADLIVGAPGTPTGPDASTVYISVYLGGSSGLATIPALTITHVDGMLGSLGAIIECASAGDVNGDGYADVIAGTHLPGTPGSAIVFLGGASGLASVPATTLTGDDVSVNFGVAVASAGDVNGDGYADVVVGAPAASATARGRVYVYLGSASGLAGVPATTLTGPDVLGGAGASTSFGVSIAGAGDLNGDGYSDVVVGDSLSLGQTGSAFVYLGSAAGLAAASSTTLVGLDSGSGFFGASVSSAGDVNGDGYTDVAVGAYATPDGSGVGSAYIYLGGPTGLATLPAASLTDPGMVAGADYGWSVSSGGDENDDGKSEIVVGAPHAFPGYAYVYLGTAAGVASAPATKLLAPDVMNGDFGSVVFGATD